MEGQFYETVETQPELLAYHYTAAGLIEPAMDSWQRAGQRALQRSANLEAVAHLRQGLELLMTLPDTPARTECELDFQMALGPALMATKGYATPEVGNAYTRARELCQHVGESPRLFSVLYGLCIFHIVRAELQTARELAEQLLSLAQRQSDLGLLLVAHQALGTTLFQVGEFATSLQHFEQGIALYNSQQHHTLALLYAHDFGVVCRSYAAAALGCLGFLDAALHRSHEALTLSQELSHPYSQAWALQLAARFHQCRREYQIVYEQADASLALYTEQGFALFAVAGTILRGWAEAWQGPGEAGIVHMRQGLAAWRAAGAELNRPYFLALLAEAYGKHSQVQEGLCVLVEAQAAVHKTDDHWYEAELYRLEGELLLRQPEPDEQQAETCFRQALDVARQQQAKFLELHATTSLARLWWQQDKRQDAYDLLAPVYGWFTEGFDTADLKEAKALLEELRHPKKRLK